eukprot:TRINITY_DN34934_c0_g1_i1.p1 TRINITY_DN34934_c0_g1~~TRINITY_DN34934_c0_g1_i1.p1  ORF type:complete len:229 (-),score=34.15 TRINITY_DN34934_c0_g1_i1:153-785(-)
MSECYSDDNLEDNSLHQNDVEGLSPNGEQVPAADGLAVDANADGDETFCDDAADTKVSALLDASSGLHAGEWERLVKRGLVETSLDDAVEEGLFNFITFARVKHLKKMSIPKFRNSEEVAEWSRGLDSAFQERCDQVRMVFGQHWSKCDMRNLRNASNKSKRDFCGWLNEQESLALTRLAPKKEAEGRDGHARQNEVQGSDAALAISNLG